MSSEISKIPKEKNIALGPPQSIKQTPSGPLSIAADKTRAIARIQTFHERKAQERSLVGHIQQINTKETEIDIAYQTHQILGSSMKLIKSEKNSSNALPLSIVSTGLKVSSVAFSIFQFFSKSAALKSAVEKLSKALSWGSFIDKIEATLNFLISLCAFLTASSGLLSYVGIATTVLLGVPILFIKIFLQVLLTLRGIIQAWKMYINLKKIQKCSLTEKSPEEKAIDFLTYIGDKAQAIHKQVTEISKIKNVKDVDKIIQERIKDHFENEFGKEITKKLLRRVSDSKEPYFIQLKQDIDLIKVLETAPQQTKRKERLIQEALKFLNFSIASLDEEKNTKIYTALLPIAALSAIVLGVLSSPSLAIAAVVVSIAASIAKIVLNILSLRKSYIVSADQQQWLSKMVIDALVQEARQLKTEQEIKQFFTEHQFTFSSNLTFQNVDNALKEFRKYLKNKIRTQGDQITLSFSLIEKLKKFREWKLESPETLEELNKEFDAFFQKLFSEQQGDVKGKSWKILQKIRRDPRFEKLLQDASYQFEKQREKLKKSLTQQQGQRFGFVYHG